VIQPNITHVPCDLDQQRKRRVARRDSVARAVAWRAGRRTVLDRLLRRRGPVGELAAEDVRHDEAEDVYHGFLV
jgi:hypothetical protein